MAISNGRGAGPEPDASHPHPGAAHGGADSAGFPWAGRTFDAHDTAYADDDGTADAALIDAIGAVRAGGSPVAVVEALRTARLLVPLIAEAGDVGHTEDGKVVDKTQELSIVTVAGPDGRAVMPVFSSVETMRSWDQNARPIPADGRRIALAAASESTELVVIDPTAPSEFVLRRPAVWALGRDVPWVPCTEDAEIARAFAASVASEPTVVGVDLVPGDPLARFAGPELTVRLVLVGGLGREDLSALIGRLQQRWSNDPYVAEHVDSMGISLVEA